MDGIGGVVAPLVFQCNSCMSIVGDTFSFIEADKDRGLVTLSHTSNVSQSVQIKRLDDGSTFNEIKCARCSVKLGRVYLSAPKGFEHLRGMVTLANSSIRTYELGVNDGRGGDNPQPSWREMVACGPRIFGLGGPAGPMAKRQRKIESWCKSQFQSSAAELVKVKNMILVLNERLTAVEESNGMQVCR